MQDIQDFFANVFSGFSITDAVDIAIVALVVYYLLKLILGTRAEQIIKGILILFIATIVSEVLELHTLNWMCKGALALGAVAIIIVLQPELRRALELMGRGKIIGALGKGDKENSKRAITSIVNTVEKFSNDRTGALIVFERKTMLENYVESGTILNAKITEQLLGNIFYEGAPLHDGAVIISRFNLYAAGCVLPLTKSQTISKDLGTRHRAGIGITELSDALVLIVSEETGIISMAEDGNLERFMDIKSVEKRLLDVYLNNHRAGERKIKVFGKEKVILRKNNSEMKEQVYGKGRKEKEDV